MDASFVKIIWQFVFNINLSLCDFHYFRKRDYTQFKELMTYGSTTMSACIVYEKVERLYTVTESYLYIINTYSFHKWTMFNFIKNKDSEIGDSYAVIITLYNNKCYTHGFNYRTVYIFLIKSYTLVNYKQCMLSFVHRLFLRTV